MIPQYINDWLSIIEGMQNDNTYKLAWGRALIECIAFDHYKKDNKNIIVPFNDISHIMLKYYWNQLFFFKLKQAPYIDKDPVICKDTASLIEIYKIKTNSNIPIWFDEAENWFLKNNKDAFNKTINHISKALHKNVSWRFKNINGTTIEIYQYNKNDPKIIITNEQASLIKEYSIILSKLLNYKWAQLLEKFNYAPKITSKVNGISENKLRRNSLTEYKNELLKQFKGKAIIDFYTGKPLKANEISIDHVIPWSFMYSDDIWNLVITNKSYNSSKSNSIPNDEIIRKLKERNTVLSPLLSNKYQVLMNEAIHNNYVDKFYFESKL